MNKKGLSMPFEKIIALILGLIIIIALIFFARKSISDLTKYFLEFIKSIVK